MAVAVAETARRVLSPRERPIEPARVDLRDYFSPAEIERGTRYARPQRALALARSAVDVAAISYLVVKPPAWLRKGGQRPAAEGAVAGALLATGLALPTLPLSAISRRRAIAVGLDTQSWPDWGRDLVKASAISAVFAGGAGAAVVAATRRWPRTWWAPAAAGSVALGAVLAALAPVVLDPIFNDFTPLPEGETRDDVLELRGVGGGRSGPGLFGRRQPSNHRRQCLCNRPRADQARRPVRHAAGSL